MKKDFFTFFISFMMTEAQPLLAPILTMLHIIDKI